MLKLLIIFSILFSLNLNAADFQDGVTHLSQRESLEKMEKESNDIVIIDVRTAAEFSNGYLKNAINIPHDQILNNVSLLDEYKNKDMIFYCHTGVRAKKVTDLLSSKEYKNLYRIKGDFRAWRSKRQPIDSKI